MRDRLLALALLLASAGCSDDERPGAPSGGGGGLGPRPDAGRPDAEAPMDAGGEDDAGDEDDAGAGAERPDVFQLDGLYLSALGDPPNQAYVVTLQIPVDGETRLPNLGIVGLPNGTDLPRQLSSSGRIVYVHELDTLREMRCDGMCVPWRPGTSYPSRPEGNDPDVTFAACKERIAHYPGPERDLATCDNSHGLWLDSRGRTVHTGEHRIRHVGRGDLVLAYEDSASLRGTVVVDVDSGQQRVVSEPWDQLRAVRAVDGGFLVAGDVGAEVQLWMLDADGSVGARGTYPALPEGVVDNSMHGLALMGDGTLYRFAKRAVGEQQLVVRMTTDGDSQVAFADQGSLIQDGLPRFLTGP